MDQATRALEQSGKWFAWHIDCASRRMAAKMWPCCVLQAAEAVITQHPNVCFVRAFQQPRHIIMYFELTTWVSFACCCPVLPCVLPCFPMPSESG